MRLKLALAAALLPFASSCQARELPELGLMGTIPIYWGESGAFGDQLNGRSSPHWARAELEKRYALRPLDTLSAENLSELHFLLLAQPRALSPAENVALDAWVRRGGRLLLFADPMLTGQSRFAIGDRRRPQDVILLSPLLEHWGLDLAFDVEAPEGWQAIDDGGLAIPVDRPGELSADSGAGHCTVTARAVLARCRIGAGQAVILADAAVLDLYDHHSDAPKALDWLVEQGFGDDAGVATDRGRPQP
jgi:hypothetical protein